MEQKKQKGGRKPKTEDQLKTKKINIRITESEEKKIKELRKKIGSKETLSQEIRNLYFDHLSKQDAFFDRPKEKKIRTEVQLLRTEILKIGVNINQIAHRVNTNKELATNPYFIQSIQEDLKNGLESLKKIAENSEKWL